MLEKADLDVDERRSRAPQLCERGLDGNGDPWVDHVGLEEVPYDPDTEAGDPARQLARVGGDRRALGGRVRRVVPCDRFENERAVLGGARDRADGVEEPRDRDDAAVRDPPPARAHTRHAVEGGRDPDRAGRIGPERPGRKAGRGAGAGAAARAAADPFEIPRVVCGAGVRARGHCPVGELVGVELPEDQRPGSAETRDDEGIRRRDVLAPEDLRPGRRRRAGDVDHVLDRQRHAPEPLADGRPSLRLQPGCLRERLLGEHRDVRIERGVENLDPVEEALDRLARGQLAGPEPARQARNAHRGVSSGRYKPAGTVSAGTSRSSSSNCG